MSRRERGQVVLLAAAAIAIALVPMVLAYMQLGYGADVEAISTDPAPEWQVERVLTQALREASADVPATYASGEHGDAAETVRDRLEPTIEDLAVSDLGAETVYLVEPNETRARQVASEACPGGPSREFGNCVIDGGLVLQGRAGDAHVVAAGFDVTIVEESTERRMVLTVGNPMVR